MNAQFFVSLVVIVVAANVMLLACAYLILLERKVAAWVQGRLGPNRTNLSFGVLPFKGRQLGLGQALADGAKLLFKEDYTPPHVDRALFLLAPALVMIPALIGWAVIPWGGLWAFPGIDWGWLHVEPGTVSVAVAPLGIGLVYLLAVGSLAVYGVVLGAYASNNKYSFLGGVRATAQMVSYEIPMGLCVLIMILTFATADAGLMTNLQNGAGASGIWGLFMHPLLAVIFFACLLAEANRAPFDLAEAEGELIGGYHTEYGSMKWALFFLGEYMHMITGSAFFCILFLGGFDLVPFAAELPMVAGPGVGGLGVVALKVLVFVVKVLACIVVMMWVRWTFPRFRFDQLMRVAWRNLIPMTIAILLLSGVVVFLNLDNRWLTAGLFLAVDVAVGITGAILGPMLPQGPPINRRVRLVGSRFNAPEAG